MKIGDLKPDKRNANKGTERGAYMLEESLRKYGAGRSILIDKHGNVIAGNKTLEQAGSIGMDEVLVVKSDGKKLVAVQRTDLDLDSPQARALAYADNRVSEIDYALDVDMLLQDIQGGLDLNAFWRQDELDELLKQADVSSIDLEERKDSGKTSNSTICPKCGFEWQM
jgi:hypothetical protein